MGATDVEVLEDLRAIREELGFIKAHLVDADTMLTPQEARRHDDALAAHRAGKAVPLDKIRR